MTDADPGTRRFVQELRELSVGNAAQSGDVLVTIYTAREPAEGMFVLQPVFALVQAAFSAIMRRGDLRYLAAIYDRSARPGDRARLVVPLDADPALGSVRPACPGTFYGIPRVGHALAVAIDEHLYFPILPACRPSRRTPKLAGP